MPLSELICKSPKKGYFLQKGLHFISRKPHMGQAWLTPIYTFYSEFQYDK